MIYEFLAGSFEIYTKTNDFYSYCFGTDYCLSRLKNTKYQFSHSEANSYRKIMKEYKI